MSWRPHPRNADTDPNFPRAWATCEACGFVWNHHKLGWQFEWAGLSLVNERLLKCPYCLDIPNEQLRTITLPPDPPAIREARPEQYSIDEGDMPLTTEPAFTGDPGSVIRDENGDYIPIDPGTPTDFSP